MTTDSVTKPFAWCSRCEQRSEDLVEGLQAIVAEVHQSDVQVTSFLATYADDGCEEDVRVCIDVDNEMAPGQRVRYDFHWHGRHGRRNPQVDGRQSIIIERPVDVIVRHGRPLWSIHPSTVPAWID